MALFVIFEENGQEYATTCFRNDNAEQAEMMHRLDVDKQVKEWQKTNSGNPPRFHSRITIKRFTNERLGFSNIKALNL